MPVPVQRDPERTRAALAGWLSARVAGGGLVEVGDLTVPAGAGFGNETVLFDAAWPGGGQRLVARIAGAGYQVYPDVRFAEQYRLLAVLAGHPDVPVPPVLGFEPDPGVLGAPFFVMAHVDGRVPADLPSYHRAGWVADLDPAGRREVWERAVDVLAAVHRLDPQRLGLRFLARPGRDPLLEHYAANLAFFGAGGAVVERALAWLRVYRPAPPARPVLLWGDARLGNLVFDGTEVAGVLDWEMAELGPPEADVAWFLHLDRHLSEGVGAPRLAGLPGREETLARYAAAGGPALRDLGYHAVLAAFRFALITARVTALLRRQQVVPADFPLHRNAVALLDRVLAETAAQPAVP
ncbi:phosphotransferase family protein [Amycolatopsis sp. lyj-23]|uniref:phosphotransferase family protein n=1 Tax=Amycolatopsis sp. lyj-23 TaxID=2789283 RepID=UPI0039793B24